MLCSIISLKLYIRVSLKMSFVDWPTCLDHFEFDYYNTLNNKSAFKKIFKAPFKPVMEFELLNNKIPCRDDFVFNTRVKLKTISQHKL